MAIADRLAVITKRLLDSLTPEERAGGVPAGFLMDADDTSAIDDGQYGDPDRSTRPEWMAEQEAGWEPIKR
ncbi:MAG: hypothetical protein ABIH03_15825 [Pseudomonadota bacterium]